VAEGGRWGLKRTPSEVGPLRVPPNNIADVESSPQPSSLEPVLAVEWLGRFGAAVGGWEVQVGLPLDARFPWSASFASF
jgi:hypothetical protein